MFGGKCQDTLCMERSVIGQCVVCMAGSVLGHLVFGGKCTEYPDYGGKCYRTPCVWREVYRTP